MPEWNPNLSCMAKISSSETKDHNSTSLFFISYHHAHCSWHICPARITTYRPDKQRYHSGQISDVMWCDMISKLIQLKRRRRRKKACLQMVAVCTLFHCKGIWFPKALIPFQFITEPLLSQRRKSTLLCKFQRVHENDIYSSRRNKINVGNLETERFSSKHAVCAQHACNWLTKAPQKLVGDLSSKSQENISNFFWTTKYRVKKTGIIINQEKRRNKTKQTNKKGIRRRKGLQVFCQCLSKKIWPCCFQRLTTRGLPLISLNVLLEILYTTIRALEVVFEMKWNWNGIQFLQQKHT